MAERLIFHYHDRRTLIHRIDPRVKVLLLFALSTALLMVNSLQTVAIAGYIAAAVLMAKLPVTRYRRELRFFLIIFAIILLARWLSGSPFLEGALFGFRFLLIVAASILFTDTTAPEEITLALYWYLRPLKFLNPKRIAARFNLTLAFFPLIFDAILEIREARRARLDNSWSRPLRRMISISSQIFDLILIKAEEISFALEARLFDEDILHGSIAFSRIDLAAVLVTAAVSWGLWIIR